MWRYNRAKFRWELVDLEGDIKGWIAMEMVYAASRDQRQQLRFNEMVREQFGIALPTRAFSFSASRPSQPTEGERP